MILYVLEIKKLETYKIGVTDNLEKRIKQLQTGSPEEITVVNYFEYELPKQAFKIEKILHKKFKKHQTQGEWFKGISTKDIEKVIFSNRI